MSKPHRVTWSQQMYTNHWKAQGLEKKQKQKKNSWKPTSYQSSGKYPYKTGTFIKKSQKTYCTIVTGHPWKSQWLGKKKNHPLYGKKSPRGYHQHASLCGFHNMCCKLLNIKYIEHIKMNPIPFSSAVPYDSMLLSFLLILCRNKKQHNLFFINSFWIGLSHSVRADLHLRLNHTGHGDYSWAMQKKNKKNPHLIMKRSLGFFKIGTCIMKMTGMVGCHVGAESVVFFFLFLTDFLPKNKHA